MSTTTHRDRPRDDQPTASTSSEGVRLTRTPAAGRKQRRFAIAVAAVAFTLAAVVAVVLSARPTPVDVPAAEPRAGAGTTAVDEDEALRRLIARGYVPAATARPNQTTGVQAGLSPAEHAATDRLVRRGLLPPELLEAESYVTDRLINQGLIPAGSARQ